MDTAAVLAACGKVSASTSAVKKAAVVLADAEGADIAAIQAIPGVRRVLVK